MSCQQEKEQAAELQGNSATETSLRKVWLSAAIGMLAEKMDKGEVKEEQITGVIVEAVAAEASYSYAGRRTLILRTRCRPLVGCMPKA